MNLFEIFFLRVTLIDVLDIGIVAFLIYTLYRVMRRTIAIQVFIALTALYLFDVIVTAADLTMLKFLFRTLSEVFVVAIIVLFQPELRRMLLMLGQTTRLQKFLQQQDPSRVVDEILSAIEDMSQQKMGGLLVFSRNTPLDTFIETGTLVQAQVNSDLILSIFQKYSPLHDGAMIIQGNRVEAVRCILPVSQSRLLSPQLGLRHRSAMGMAEQTDAFVVVVSEETGQIATAQDGELHQGLSLIALRNEIHTALSAKAPSGKTSGTFPVPPPKKKQRRFTRRSAADKT